MANGLDTRGVADGFMKGYSFMQGIEDKKDSKSRQERLDQENRDYRAQSQQNWETTRTDNLAAREQSQANTDRAFGLNMQQFNQTKEHNQWSRNRTDSQDAIAAADREYQKKVEEVSRVLMSGDPTLLDDRYDELINSDPRLRPMSIGFYADPKTQEALDYYEKVKDPNDPASFMDDKSAAVASHLLEQDINTDRNGRPLEGKRSIYKMLPGKKEGTITSGLLMEDGRKTVMTEGRGTEEEGDNIVHQQEIKPMIQKIEAMLMTNKQLKSTPKGRAILAAEMQRKGQRLGLIPKDKAPNWEIIKRTITDDNGNKLTVPVARHNKTTGEYVPFNEPNSAPTDINPNLEAKAEDYADRRISELASPFSLDSSDFKQWGGSREKAREALKKEYIELQSNAKAKGLNIPSSQKSSPNPTKDISPLQAILDANPSWSQTKAEAYLAHLNKR
jgi:hypothetical protein